MPTTWTEQNSFDTDIDFYDNDTDFYDSDTDFYDTAGQAFTAWDDRDTVSTIWERRGVDGSLLDYDDSEDDFDDTMDTLTGQRFTDWTDKVDP